MVFAKSTPHTHFAPNIVTISSRTPTAEFHKAHNTSLSRVTSFLNPLKAVGLEGCNSTYD